MTNATKAQLITIINTLLILVVSFGVELSDAQTVAIVGAVNAVLSLVVGLTYTNSAKRVEEPGTS